jgi:hypothetical protein
MNFVYQVCRGTEITDEVLAEGAKLFCENYGIWGPEASSKIGKFAKAGNRVRMNSARLKQQCLPAGADNVYVKVMDGSTLAGNVFATRWVYEGRNMCWITQLVVSGSYRKHGLATQVCSAATILCLR